MNFRNSVFWNQMVQAWELCCDVSLPASWRPDADSITTVPMNQLLRFFPVWGFVFMLVTLMLGAILRGIAGAVSGGIVFALLLSFACEMRTKLRGMALCVSALEAKISGASPSEAWQVRKSSIRALQGSYASALILLALIIRFGSLYVCFAIGCPIYAGSAMVLALGAEAILALDETSETDKTIRNHVLFFTIFGLLLAAAETGLWLSSLLAIAGSAAILFYLKKIAMRVHGKLTSDDMTSAGYLVELWALLSVLWNI